MIRMYLLEGPSLGIGVCYVRTSVVRGGVSSSEEVLWGPTLAIGGHTACLLPTALEETADTQDATRPPRSTHPCIPSHRANAETRAWSASASDKPQPPAPNRNSALVPGPRRTWGRAMASRASHLCLGTHAGPVAASATRRHLPCPSKKRLPAGKADLRDDIPNLDLKPPYLSQRPWIELVVAQPKDGMPMTDPPEPV